MASLAVASSVSMASSASTLAGVRVGGASSRNVQSASVKMAPVRCQVRSDEEVMKRRAVVAGTAAAVLALVASSPRAEAEEPKKGSKEAKKKYANICVTMPTAEICLGPH